MDPLLYVCVRVSTTWTSFFVFLLVVSQVVDGFMSKMKNKAEAGDTTAGLVDQLNLEEFASVLDNAPPGTDELVALSKVRT